MAAGKYNFTIEQGSTVDFEVNYADSNGDPIDLTTYDHARMMIKSSKSTTDPIIYLSSSTNGFSHGKINDINGDLTGLSLRGSGLNQNHDDLAKPFTSGSIGVYISAESSSELSFDQAFYDLELVSGSISPVVFRILEGKIKLSKEVTTTPSS